MKILQERGMNLLLRLSSALPREIVSSAFFWINLPTEEEFIDACKERKRLLIEQWLSLDISTIDHWPILIVAQRDTSDDILIGMATDREYAKVLSSFFLKYASTVKYLPLSPPIQNIPLLRGIKNKS